ncbi:MAG TPA: hypothetical protein VKB12_14030, partial [Pyrinomonadaceae bacterium]|nr:hypothetical protein [Pyrinomonadaceae bacterium]
MKFITLAACALACAFAFGAVNAAAQAAPAAQDDSKVSGGEREAAEKINKAKGAEAKLQAASEFIKKYPKSTLRPRVAGAVSGEILSTQDAAQKAALIETFVAFFNDPAEAELVNGPLLAAYIDANRPADAFKLAPVWVGKHPDDIDTLRRLAITGSNAAITGENAYVADALKYGLQAVEMIEGDKRPASIDAAQWADYKTKFLPGLYREVGVLSLRTGDNAGARTRLEKAIALGTDDPATYAIVGQMNDEEYVQFVNAYKAAPAGAARDAALKKAQDQLDKVIDLYA